MTTAIPMDADTAAETLLNKWKTAEDASEPSEEDTIEVEEEVEENTDEDTTSDDADDESSESDSEESEGEDDEDSEAADEGNSDDDSDETETKTVIDSEDAVVKIKVDGEEVEASIKDLKRLYGQEASLTRKSQEAAQIKKAAEEAGAYHVAGLETLLQRAVEKYKPYQNLNILALTKDPTVTQEEIVALTEASKAAYDDVQFLQQELDTTIKRAQTERQNAIMAQARETHKLLSDPEKGIEGWGEPLYNDIRSFAIEQGLHPSVVDEIVDPVGIKLLHMAMRYAKVQKTVNTSTTKPKKVDKTPKKIVKGAPQEVIRKTKPNPTQASLKKLKSSGSQDDAVEALMARWSQN